MERERDLEKRLAREIRRMGGRAYKWTSPGEAGVPDRIVIMPGGSVYFVEMKAEGGVLSGLQKLQIRRLRGLGVRCLVLTGRTDLEKFLGYLRMNLPDWWRAGDDD